MNQERLRELDSDIKVLLAKYPEVDPKEINLIILNAISSVRGSAEHGRPISVLNSSFGFGTLSRSKVKFNSEEIKLVKMFKPSMYPNIRYSLIKSNILPNTDDVLSGIRLLVITDDELSRVEKGLSKLIERVKPSDTVFGVSVSKSDSNMFGGMLDFNIADIRTLLLGVNKDYDASSITTDELIEDLIDLLVENSDKEDDEWASIFTSIKPDGIPKALLLSNSIPSVSPLIGYTVSDNHVSLIVLESDTFNAMHHFLDTTILSKNMFDCRESIQCIKSPDLVEIGGIINIDIDLLLKLTPTNSLPAVISNHVNRLIHMAVSSPDYLWFKGIK